MDFTIRKALAEDARQLAPLLREVGWFDTFKNTDINTLTAGVSLRLRECLADASHCVYVAQSPAGEIVGYGSVHWLLYLFTAGPEGYVSELFVREFARGQGVGRRLLDAIETEARARGCTRLSLLNLRHRESYQRQFYVKAGWYERGEAANFVYALS